MRARRPARAGVLLALFAAAACDTGPDGVAATIPSPLETDTALMRELRVVRAEPVVGFAGPGGTPFRVRARTPDVELAPCANCHEDAGPGAGPEEERHRDLTVVHPRAAGSECAACHETRTPERLRLADGSSASLDEAYRLCAGCHFEEAEAWAGGAHGKRIAGWRGERVILSCTGCHDPHAPAFDKRIPRPGPRIPRTGGRTP